ncbi:MAG: glycosyltransferase family 1 protein [bacterium]|nr:glycosyltransferase family 1 protein [bacterium]MCP5070574.1 glycosyltransferase family 1 protein [bacterium]
MSLDPGIPLVLVASAVWDTPAPVNVHQIARRFAARGHRVLFVESSGLRGPSVSSSHDLQRIAARLRKLGGGPREVAPGLFVLGPLALPGANAQWLRRVSGWALGAQVAGAMRRLGMDRPILWSFVPTGLLLADRIPHRGLVYHCVDDYAGNPGVDPERIAELEAGLLERAELVVATSPVLAERLGGQRADVRLAANVADTSLFSRAVGSALPEPDELADLPHPRLLYVGNLAAYRIDPALLRAALDAAPGAALVLVGAAGLGDVGTMPPALTSLLADPRVRAVGPKPHAELPAWMQHCDVALIPFLDSAHTRASLPLKLWEYLSAGLPVVARALPNLEGLEREGVRTASTPAAYSEAVAEAVEEPRTARVARSRGAQDHGWEARIETLAEWLGGI